MVSGLEGCHSGAVLMSAGIPISMDLEEYEGIQFSIEAV